SLAALRLVTDLLVALVRLELVTTPRAWGGLGGHPFASSLRLSAAGRRTILRPSPFDGITALRAGADGHRLPTPRTIRPRTEAHTAGGGTSPDRTSDKAMRRSI